MYFGMSVTIVRFFAFRTYTHAISHFSHFVLAGPRRGGSETTEPTWGERWRARNHNIHLVTPHPTGVCYRLSTVHSLLYTLSLLYFTPIEVTLFRGFYNYMRSRETQSARDADTKSQNSSSSPPPTPPVSLA